MEVVKTKVKWLGPWPLSYLKDGFPLEDEYSYYHYCSDANSVWLRKAHTKEWVEDLPFEDRGKDVHLR